jgi:sugar/nucleoside kinase (ribokinase family)
MQLNDNNEPTDSFATDTNKYMLKPVDVVCFGILFPLLVATIDEYPKADSGADILSLNKFIGADAPITSFILDGLGCRVGLISNDVGNDPGGHELLDRLKRTDIVTAVSPREDVSTPFCLTVVDRDSNRTWFTLQSDAIESLLTADLSLVHQTDFLYVDAYPQMWQASVRVIDCALDLGVPIFVNLDQDVPNEELSRRLLRGTSFIQRGAVGQSIEKAREMAQTLFDSYSPSLCIITMAQEGVIYTNHSGTYHLPAHDIEVANTAGAGATFSAGLIFGRVRSWSDDETVAFANALAGLYCSVPSGFSCFSMADVMEFSASRGLKSTKLC